MKLQSLLSLFVLSVTAYAAPGDLVSFKPLTSTPPDMIAAGRDKLCPALKSVPKAYGFKRIRVEYKTQDLRGNEVTSAGLVMVPITNGPFSTLVYQHGTSFARKELPSSSPFFGEGDAIGVCFSSLGYLTVLADYLGYGDGTGVHPYLHADSEAWTARDLMRAVRPLLTQLNVQVNGKLFITGYSQGGHAAMALLRLLEKDPAKEFKVTAAAPMAGPYAISSSIEEIAGNPSRHSAGEAAYLLVGLNPIYTLYKDVRDVFQAPYAEKVEALLDGTHPSPEVFAVLNMKPTELIQPKYFEDVILNHEAPLNVALRANDVYEWIPDSTIPIRLYHGKGDREVPYSNAEKAFVYMQAQGAKIELINLGDAIDHAAGFPLGVGQTALWFETF